MGWRFRNDQLNPTINRWLISDGTGGNVQSSDFGKSLMTLSSNKAALLQGTSLAPTIPIIGILQGLSDTNGDPSTGSTAGAGIFANIMTISANEILELDYSTAWSDSTVSFLLTTNIGKYLGNCSSNGIAAGGSSVATNGDLGKFLNYSTATNVANTSQWIRLAGIPRSTNSKYAFVQIPSSHLWR